MAGLIYFILFVSAFKYIYGSLKNIINLEKMVFGDIELNFYFNYLTLLLGILFLISVFGSIKKNKIFVISTLIFIILEIIYLIYAIIFLVINNSPMALIIYISIYLIIDVLIARYIKNNWLKS